MRIRDEFYTRSKSDSPGGGELKSNREKKKTQIRPEKTGFTSDKKIHPLTFLGSEQIRSESDKTTRIRLEDLDPKPWRTRKNTRMLESRSGSYKKKYPDSSGSGSATLERKKNSEEREGERSPTLQLRTRLDPVH